MDTSTEILTASQAYCLDLMGITRWKGVSQEQNLVVFRSHSPWLDQDQSLSTAFDEDVIVPSLPETEIFNQGNGFNNKAFSAAVADKKHDVIDQNRSVHSLKAELGAAPEVIVEDLQPIEELAVEIAVPDVTVAASLPKNVQCISYLIDNKILILSDIPPAFQDGDAIEKLALNMSQALLKRPVANWQSSHFSWPLMLKNPYFLGRSDWMLGAFESFLDSQLSAIQKGESTSGKNDSADEEPSLWLVLAGQTVQQLMSEMKHEPMLEQVQTVRIVSLPELYRIPEYKGEAWQSLQAFIANK